MGQFEAVFNYLSLVVGPCAVVYSIVSAMRTRSFVRRSVEVDGEVIQLQQSTSRGRSGYTYAPVFLFTAADGVKHTVTSDVGSSPAGFEVGDAVRIRYDPADPQRARIHSFFQTWGAAFLSAVVGVGFTCIACKAFGFLLVAR